MYNIDKLLFLTVTYCVGTKHLGGWDFSFKTAHQIGQRHSFSQLTMNIVNCYNFTTTTNSVEYSRLLNTRTDGVDAPATQSTVVLRSNDYLLCVCVHISNYSSPTSLRATAGLGTSQQCVSCWSLSFPNYRNNSNSTRNENST